MKKKVKSIEQYRLTEEDKKNIVTPEQLKTLGNYRRELKQKKANDRINNYKEIIKNNEEHLLNYIEDIIMDLNGNIIQEVEFKYNIFKFMRKILENEGIKNISKAHSKIIYNFGEQYWDTYLNKTENSVIDNDKIEPLNDSKPLKPTQKYKKMKKRKHKKKYKNDDDLPRTFSIVRSNPGRKYNTKLSGIELDNYKLDYLFYTTDRQNSFSNKD